MVLNIHAIRWTSKIPLKKGKIAQWGRGVNSILIIWRNMIFPWWHLFRLIKRIIFKKKLSKTDLPFRFCKIRGNWAPKLKYFIYFSAKNGCLFVVLVLQICPNLTTFFQSEKYAVNYLKAKDTFQRKSISIWYHRT